MRTRIMQSRSRRALAGPAIDGIETQILIVNDPYLLFYLRWSVVLEREADAVL